MTYNLSHIIHLIDSDGLKYARIYTKDEEKDYSFKTINKNSSEELKKGFAQIAESAPGNYWVVLRKSGTSKEEYFHQEVELKTVVPVSTNSPGVYDPSEIERIVNERIVEIKRVDEIDELKTENEVLKTGAGKLAYMVEVLVEKFSAKFIPVPSQGLQGVPGNSPINVEMTDNEKAQLVLKTLLEMYTIDEAVKIVQYLYTHETARNMVDTYALGYAAKVKSAETANL